MSYNKNLLGNLFGSKAKVLKLFFHYPQVALSLRDIARKAVIKDKIAAAVVKDLVKSGVLEKVKNRVAKKTKKLR